MFASAWIHKAVTLMVLLRKNWWIWLVVFPGQEDTSINLDAGKRLMSSKALAESVNYQKSCLSSTRQITFIGMSISTVSPGPSAQRQVVIFSEEQLDFFKRRRSSSSAFACRFWVQFSSIEASHMPNFTLAHFSE